MGFLSRKPNSNDPPVNKNNPWGGDEWEDDTALVVNKDGARCFNCQRVARNCFLYEGLCPDCYQEKYGDKSPALKQVRDQEMRDSVGCASGEAGEAD